MSESVARAERFEPAAASPLFTWEVSGKPVAVQIPHGIVDRLEKEAVESFRSLSSRGSEIGGLLLGRITPGQPAMVTIEEYEAVPCDYSRGPLYRLSEADAARMDQIIEQRNAGGIAVVGFFRSHTRKGLGLDADDLELFRIAISECLADRPVDSPVRDQTQHGRHLYPGIRHGAGRSQLPGISVPVVGTRRRPRRSAPNPVTAGPKSAVPPLPSAPKAPPRAQIVPIAPRRETPAVAPALPPIERCPQVPAPVETPHGGLAKSESRLLRSRHLTENRETRCRSRNLRSRPRCRPPGAPRQDALGAGRAGIGGVDRRPVGVLGVLRRGEPGPAECVDGLFSDGVTRGTDRERTAAHVEPRFGADPQCHARGALDSRRRAG